MGFGGIDFNPEPQGGDPIAGLTNGVNLGLGLQRAQLAQQENQRAQQVQTFEMEKQKKDMEYVARERRNKDFRQGLELINDTKFTSGFSPEIVNQVLNSQIKPYITEDLGIPVEGELSYAVAQPLVKKFTAIMGSKAPMDMKKAEIGKLFLTASVEEQKQLKSASDLVFPETYSGIPRQTGRVTKDGLPVFFDPAIRSYAYADSATGTSVPYREQTFAPSGNPSSGSETKLADIFQQRSIVDESLKVMSPELVGPLDRAYKNVGAYMDESTDPQALYFKSLTEMANTVIRNGYYGATLTNNEKKAFEDIALTRSLSPSAFAAKARGLQSSFNKMEGGIRRAADAANRPFRDAPSSSSSGAQDNDPLGLFK